MTLFEACAYVGRENQTGTRANILVIEDHVDTGIWLGRALQDQDFAVRWERRPEHALLALGEDPRPDAVLLDLLMPGLHGSFIYERIRENQALTDTPILVVTAVADEDLPVWNDPRVRFLTKPVSRQAILESLDTLLQA